MNHIKFGHFVNFITYFSGKNVVPPKVDSALTPMAACVTGSADNVEAGSRARAALL